MPLAAISVPMPTSALQAGTSSEMNASDSANASTNTIGEVQAPCTRTNSTTAPAIPSTVIQIPAPAAFVGATPAQFSAYDNSTNALTTTNRQSRDLIWCKFVARPRV